MREKAEELFLRRRTGVRHLEARTFECWKLRGFLAQRPRQTLVPFVADKQHCLGDIERSEGGIDGCGDDHVGKRYLVIAQAPALASEQDAGFLASIDAPAHVAS